MNRQKMETHIAS